MSQSVRQLWDSLTPRARWLTVGVGVALVAAYFFPQIRATLFPAPIPVTAPPTVDGRFKATDGQWATLKIVPVTAEVFRTERDTDGKVMLDDDRTTPVYSPYSGQVIRVIAEAGATVAKGDPLLTVMASEFVQGENDLLVAVAARTAAKAALTVAIATEQRTHDLYEAQGGALKDWQQAQADLVAAQSADRTADAGLTAARDRLRILGKTDADIARLAGSPDSMAMAAETAVPAPRAGTIILRQVAAGQYINSAAAGGAQIYTIADLTRLWLVGNLREVDAPLVAVGDRVEARVPAYPGRVFTATVTYVAPSIDPDTRRITVRAVIDNADGALKPEMFADLRIITAVSGSSPAVPESAVLFEGDKAHVWVATVAEKSLALRAVRLGRAHDGVLEVVDGLQAGEMVVSKGALFIDRAAKGD